MDRSVTINFSEHLVDTAGIIAARKRGATYADLCRTFGVRKSSLMSILRQHDLHGPLHGRRLVTDDVRARVLDMAAAGMTTKQIAAETGFTPKTIWRVIRDVGGGRS